MALLCLLVFSNHTHHRSAADDACHRAVRARLNHGITFPLLGDESISGDDDGGYTISGDTDGQPGVSYTCRVRGTSAVVTSLSSG